MNTYSARKARRIPVHCQLFYFADGAVINGIVWNLLTTGWHATVDRSVPIGLEKSVFMTLPDGKACHPICIDSLWDAGLMGTRRGGKSRGESTGPHSLERFSGAGEV